MEKGSQQKMDCRLELMVLFVLLVTASSAAGSNNDIDEAVVRNQKISGAARI